MQNVNKSFLTEKLKTGHCFFLASSYGKKLVGMTWELLHPQPNERDFAASLTFPSCHCSSDP